MQQMQTQVRQEATVIKADDEFIQPYLTSRIDLKIITELEVEPAFVASDKGVYISSNNDYDLNKIQSEITNFSIPLKVAKGIIDCIGENKGKYIANLAGFYPSKDGNPPEIINANLLFGKIYVPSLNGFSFTISISSEKKQSGDIHIKIYGVGAGGKKEFICHMTQEHTIEASPSDLVIPIKFELTKWENDDGLFFFTYNVYSKSEYIEIKPTTNPYDNDNGYDEVYSMKGSVSKISTVSDAIPAKISERLETNSEIQLSASLSVPYVAAPIKINGKATVKKSFTVDYSIPTGYKFSLFTSKEPEFRHFWGKK